MIDFVITWVDGNDKCWLKEKEKYAISDDMDVKKERYRDWETLRYWFRGVEKYAPWVNHIFFVTYGHVPKWLDLSNQKLIIVRHNEFIPRKYLPTYNSHTIELNLFRIKGLSEKFVYFNDDTFLLKETSNEIFFRGNKVCDRLIFNAITPSKDLISSIQFNNICILNQYWDKRKLIKRNWSKVFSLKYGLTMIKSILNLPYRNFTGFHEDHLPISMKKSTFEKIWSLEYNILDATCMNKFRTKNDISPWLIKDWYLASGDMCPIRHRGMLFYLNNPQKCFEYIKKQKNYMICCNDAEHIEDYEYTKQELLGCFQIILPDKSSFEKR